MYHSLSLCCKYYVYFVLFTFFRIVYLFICSLSHFIYLFVQFHSLLIMITFTACSLSQFTHLSVHFHNLLFYLFPFTLSLSVHLYTVYYTYLLTFTLFIYLFPFTIYLPVNFHTVYLLICSRSHSLRMYLFIHTVYISICSFGRLWFSSCWHLPRCFLIFLELLISVPTQGFFSPSFIYFICLYSPFDFVIVFYLNFFTLHFTLTTYKVPLTFPYLSLFIYKPCNGVSSFFLSLIFPTIPLYGSNLPSFSINFPNFPRVQYPPLTQNWVKTK